MCQYNRNISIFNESMKWCAILTYWRGTTILLCYDSHSHWMSDATQSEFISLNCHSMDSFFAIGSPNHINQLNEHVRLKGYGQRPVLMSECIQRCCRRHMFCPQDILDNLANSTIICVGLIIDGVQMNTHGVDTNPPTQ